MAIPQPLSSVRLQGHYPYLPTTGGPIVDVDDVHGASDLAEADTMLLLASLEGATIITISEDETLSRASGCRVPQHTTTSKRIHRPRQLGPATNNLNTPLNPFPPPTTTPTLLPQKILDPQIYIFKIL